MDIYYVELYSIVYDLRLQWVAFGNQLSRPQTVSPAISDEIESPAGTFRLPASGTCPVPTGGDCQYET